MKKIKTLTLAVVSLLFMQNVFAQTATDINGNVYNIITIGTQDWLQENLKTTKLTDGTPISLVSDNTLWASSTTAAYCWYGNDQGLYGNTYGPLYNWYTVNTEKLCPSGWHVPNNDEWQTLVDFLGGASVAGNKLKEAGTTHWYIPNTGATNESGFTALPGGQRGAFGGFDLVKGTATFWTSTSTSPLNAETWALFYHSGYCQNVGDGKEAGKSVRCIKGSVNTLQETDASSNNYQIYPNPTRNIFYVQQHHSQDCKLQVLDLFGHTILMKTFTQQTSVSLPKAGMYIIRISDKNGIYSQPIIVE